MSASGRRADLDAPAWRRPRVPRREDVLPRPEEFDDTARFVPGGAPQASIEVGGSICDALMSNTPGEWTFPITQALIGRGITASDADVARAVRYAFEELKLVVEPGDAIGLAALLAGKLEIKDKGRGCHSLRRQCRCRHVREVDRELTPKRQVNGASRSSSLSAMIADSALSMTSVDEFAVVVATGLLTTSATAFVTGSAATVVTTVSARAAAGSNVETRGAVSGGGYFNKGRFNKCHRAAGCLRARGFFNNRRFGGGDDLVDGGGGSIDGSGRGVARPRAGFGRADRVGVGGGFGRSQCLTDDVRFAGKDSGGSGACLAWCRGNRPRHVDRCQDRRRDNSSRCGDGDGRRQNLMFALRRRRGLRLHSALALAAALSAAFSSVVVPSSWWCRL